MSRPNKQGIDYFPHDVHLDEKMLDMEIKYGLIGYAIIFKLYEKIYSKSYYCSWTDVDCARFAYQTGNQNFPGGNALEVITGIVKYALELDLFNKELYHKYKILTSAGIQKRFQLVVKRRTDCEINPDYILIPGDFGIKSSKLENDKNEFPEKEKPEEDKNVNNSYCIHNENNMNTECLHDEYKSTQSKVKEIKEDLDLDLNIYKESVSQSSFSQSDLEYSIGDGLGDGIKDRLTDDLPPGNETAPTAPTENDIKSQIRYDEVKHCLNENDVRLLDNLVMTIFTMHHDDFVVIQGQKKPKDVIKNILSKLTNFHILAIIEKFNCIHTEIRNVKDYLRTMIYNIVLELDAKILNQVRSYQNDVPDG